MLSASALKSGLHVLSKIIQSDRIIVSKICNMAIIWPTKTDLIGQQNEPLCSSHHNLHSTSQCIKPFAKMRQEEMKSTRNGPIMPNGLIWLHPISERHIQTHAATTVTNHHIDATESKSSQAWLATTIMPANTVVQINQDYK